MELLDPRSCNTEQLADGTVLVTLTFRTFQGMTSALKRALWQDQVKSLSVQTTHNSSREYLLTLVVMKDYERLLVERMTSTPLSAWKSTGSMTVHLGKKDLQTLSESNTKSFAILAKQSLSQ